ncbi:hypothetical protein OQA88_12033 [Cercophora sp. LCS_1]
MKQSTLFIGILAASANATRTCIRPSETPGCSAGKCLRAINSVPAVGEAFCSSWLSPEPVTTVVTELSTATSTRVVTETSVSAVTEVAGTVTTVVGATTVYAKRAVPSADAYADILSGCYSISSRISSACSCFLSTTVSASTVTVYESVVSTEVAESTTTTVETTTTAVTATESAVETKIVTQPIINGDFEEYLTTGNLSPWRDSTTAAGGRVEVINGGRIVVRAYPPSTGGYSSITQTFVAKPSTTYTMSFLFRCLNFDTSSGIDVYYAGTRIGGKTCTSNSASFDKASGIQFTTDATGTGEMQVRFNNPSAKPYLYFYADDFLATATGA